eukprot:Plantae.Rhodophyta-Purpureofilum_apyrenoidigerum.ctg3936.p1 GENE.Plantae.Rhodophyta-Purpureofilum_apyrenoidigerum.ctg3936~~Plantae.Rhodophyta-Purpureofilum_apyrenoidigerum.ctg3936.p1  ORF type:complete len:346 (+),score=39.26 Plantae.Rhodophyta-Purpureofilum_apyrenoidigerum.ctg3936:902-1939(+)
MFDDFGDLEAAQRLVGEMVAGVKISSVSVYRSLWNRCVQMNRQDLVKSLRHNVLQHDPKLDQTHHYEAEIRVLCSNGEAEAACDLYQHIRNANFPKSGEFYEAVMMAFAEVGDESYVRSLLDTLPISVTVRHLDFLLKAQVQNRDTESCEKLVRSWPRQYGVLPGRRTYDILLKAYIDDANMSCAWDLFNRLSRCTNPHYVKADALTYAILVEACCRNAHEEQALLLMEEMKELGKHPPTEMFNCVADFYYNKGEFKRSLQVYADMASQQIAPNRRSFQVRQELCNAASVQGTILLFSKGNLSAVTTILSRRCWCALTLHTKILSRPFLRTFRCSSLDTLLTRRR